jgi:hypothetical protein
MVLQSACYTPWFTTLICRYHLFQTITGKLSEQQSTARLALFALSVYTMSPQGAEKASELILMTTAAFA